MPIDARDGHRGSRRKDRQPFFHFAKLKRQRLTRRSAQSSLEKAERSAFSGLRRPISSWNFGEPTSPSSNSRYSKRDSSSSRRRSNNRSVLSIGAGVAISTPAALRASSGNREPPERRKFRYVSTLLRSDRTRSESATAAEIPVAYL